MLLRLMASTASQQQGVGGSGSGGGDGGGGGSGGKAGGAGNPGGAGNAGSPTSFNCVAVSPGCSYPVTANGPVTISWNAQ